MTQEQNAQTSINPLHIVDPAGSSVWIASNMHTVRWFANAYGEIIIRLSVDSGQTYPYTLVKGAYNDGIAIVTIPQDAATKNARIRVEIKDTDAAAENATDFIIEPPLSTITVLEPQPNVTWLRDEPYDITWTTTGFVENVNILISKNGGSTYIPLVSNVPNTGSYTWTVSRGSKTKRAMIKIESSGNTAVFGEMSDVFRIDNQSEPDLGMKRKKKS